MMNENNLIQMDADAIIQLAEAIIDKHRTEGCLSPLDPGLIAKLNYKLGQVKVYQDEVGKYRALGQQAQIRRDAILGLSCSSTGDGPFIVDYLRNVLTAMEEAETEEH